MDDLFGSILGAIVWALIIWPGNFFARVLRPNDADPGKYRPAVYGVLFWVVLIAIIAALNWVAGLGRH